MPNDKHDARSKRRIQWLLRHSTPRVYTATIVAITAVAASVLLWYGLWRVENAQTGQTVEAVSYAARSQLVRQIEVQLRALRDLASYWSTYGRQPREQWADDARIELAHFEGMQFIAWTDPGAGIRFYTTSLEDGFDRSPTEEEWEAVGDLMSSADAQDSEAMIGPERGEDGEYRYRVVIPVSRGEDGGVLAAVINAETTLQALLMDESPGYSIGVFWDETEIYRRDRPADRLPDEWVREGVIQLSMGPRWRVSHAPTAAWAAEMANPILPAILVAGVLIAGLLGALVFENSRARQRTRQLVEFNKKLETKVTERTRAFEDTAADLRILSESVSHDMRSPLQSVRLEVNMLERIFQRSSSDEGLQIVGRLAGATRRLATISERLGGLSEISHATFDPERVDLGALSRRIYGELTSMIDGAAPELALHDELVVNCDERLTRILLTNLLHNAVKHAQSSTAPRIEIGRVSGERREDVFFVRDNGPGFHDGPTDRLFRPFMRGETDATEGSGLGLALAAGVVRRHGGRIWVRQEAGYDGAEIRFTLAPQPE